jgi:DnaK suppressor protein
MNKDLIKKLEGKLKERKIKLESELASFAKKDPKTLGDYDTTFPDAGPSQSSDEEAVKFATYDNTLPVEYALELRLVEITKALAKIETGGYGQCEKCGKEIDPKRLEAMPEAKSCVNCQK